MKPVLLLCLFAASLHGATICTIEGEGSVTGSSSCLMETAREDAMSGFISSSISFSAGGGGVGIFGDSFITSEATVVTLEHTPEWYAVHSTFTGSYSNTFATAGPVRDGLAVIWSSINPNPGLGIDVLITLEVGTYRDPAYGEVSQVIPFTLGSAFDFTFSVDGSNWCDYSCGSNGAVHGAVFDIRFTELDGTPVSVTQAPEPGTWILMLTGFAAIGAWRRQRSRLEKRQRSLTLTPSAG